MVDDVILADRYRLGPLLGAGGMGAVYRARDLVRGGDVAVKLLGADCPDEATARRYLRAEGHVTHRIAHGNVVAILDASPPNARTPFVVMELIAGRSLRDLLHQEGPLGLLRASAIVQQALAGLHAIHTAGLVHGDVKADNVLVDARDHVTLIDLGLSHPRSDAGPGSDGAASGTPEYMAPELIRGEGARIESDLYAAGILFYELLTGSTPFAGGSALEIMRRHLEDELVPAGLRCPDRTIPRGYEDVLQRVLQKLPEARFHSARSFACTLAAVTPSSEPACAPLPIPSSPAADTARWQADPGPRRRLGGGTGDACYRCDDEPSAHHVSRDRAPRRGRARTHAARARRHRL